MKNILFAAGMLVALAACNNNEGVNPQTDGTVKMTFTARIESNTSSGNTPPSANFTQGDRVGIVPVKGEAGNMSADADQSNLPYVYGADGKFSAETTPYYFQNLEAVDFHAYYPYKTSLTTDGYSIGIETDAANQTTETDNANWRKNDILFATATAATARQPQVQFDFKHVMSMFTLTLKAGDGIADLSALTGYTLESLKLKGSFSVTNGTVTLNEADNDATGISMTVSNPTGTEVECLPLILLPQTVTDGLKLTVSYDGQEYLTTLSLPDAATALESGMNYQFTVTLKKSGLQVESTSIKPWTYKTGTGEASMKPSGADPYRVLDPGGTTWTWLDMETEETTPALEDTEDNQFYLYSGIYVQNVYNYGIDQFTSSCFSVTDSDCPWTTRNTSTKYIKLKRTIKYQYISIKFTQGKYTDLSRWSRVVLDATSASETQSLNWTYLRLYDIQGNELPKCDYQKWTFKAWNQFIFDLSQISTETDLSKVAEIRIIPNGYMQDSDPTAKDYGNANYYFDNIHLERDTDLGAEE